MDWLALALPHNSSHLFARLPFGDAVRLAALVGTGQLTWAEVNAALDARIKLAVIRARGGDDRRSMDAHEVWEQARRTAEEDIWARYHARCDAIFARDTAAHSSPQEQLRNRERSLSRLRSERDRALAALARRMAPPPRPTGAARSAAQMQITAAERDALRKLDACGFASSPLMTDAIRDLAAPLAGSVAQSA
jgi:hypothetical protein